MAAEIGRSARRWLAAAAALLAFAAVVLLVYTRAVPEQVKLVGQPSAELADWYLQLGDSLAAGYQPGAGPDPAAGYADDVVTVLREQRPGTGLRNLACPGATAVSLSEGDGGCDYTEGSQLAQALEFLRSHQGSTRAITLSIGANDALGCVAGFTLDPTCVEGALDDLTGRLPDIVGALADAAPEAEIVVLNYYNPVLAGWLTGPDGEQVADRSVPLHAALNETIAAAATASGAQVADVAAVFDSTNTAPTSLSGVGSVPTNVARICEWTWMCEAMDIHPNTVGYDVIGRVVAEELTR